MRLLLTAFFCLLPVSFLACDDGSVVSMTIDQRDSQSIQGLGLRGVVFIHVGDIETSQSPFRSNGVSIDELTVESADAVLARREDVHLLDLIDFTYDGVDYEIRIEGFEENLILDDQVDLVVYRK